MFQEGDILCNKYQLKRQFNKGGFSSVWLAHDLKAQMDFALKIYDNVEDMEEFRKGFNLVVNLNHSNIFKPLAYDVHDGIPFLVMSYCAKGSVSKLIGKINEEEVWNFAHDVASGLAYLHESKAIVHQDIKPGNILIDDNDRFMITDFDISTRQKHTVRMTARQVQEMQDFNYGSGTPEYMGPERWPEEGYVPPVKPIQASDIWSLGATLFELMEGDVPFGETGGAYQRRYKALPKMSGKFSKELKKLVRMCLAVETWNRPSAKQIAEAALKHKAPILHSQKSWMTYSAIAGGSSVMAFVAAFLLWPRGPEGFSEGMTRTDSLYLSQIQDARLIVESESAKPERYDDFAAPYVEKLVAAGKLYQDADTMSISHDSIRARGQGQWAVAQSIINREYDYFNEQEQEYRSSEAEAAADAFAQRSGDLKQFVSK